MCVCGEQGKEYRVHRLLLAYSSEYFSRLLLSNFQEGRQTYIHLRFPDPAHVFPLVLQVLDRTHTHHRTHAHNQ